MKQTRAQQRERPALASTLVLPVYGNSKKVTLETYFATMNMLARAKNLTDVLVCWMQRGGYRELMIERRNGLEYTVTLKSTLKAERSK